MAVDKFTEALIKIGSLSIRQKIRIADILSASGRSRLQTAEQIFGEIIRATRSGGQDVRDPFYLYEGDRDAMRPCLS
jgi:hypothetical protein